MARFDLRRFSDPDWLRTIAPPNLAALLRPWSAYLDSRGVPLPACPAAAIDCDALSAVLLSPDASTPADLVDALYLVLETAADAELDDLVDDARRRGLLPVPGPGDPTAADLAAALWVADSDAVRQRHAMTIARAQRSFLYFAGSHRRPRPFPDVDEATCRTIEAELDAWFAEHRRGRGCRLLVSREPGRAWLVVRHGQTMRREASHGEDGRAGTQFYRPQRHDILVYDERNDEIGVHAGTKGERALYLRTLGLRVFGQEDYFPTAERFTLAPLVEHGADALACDDVRGVDAVRLIEVRRLWGGAYKEVEVRRASDVFAALEARGEMLRSPAPVGAVFRVKFAGAVKERSVAVNVPAAARYERNEDGEAFERWLDARGFLKRRVAADTDLDGDADS